MTSLVTNIRVRVLLVAFAVAVTVLLVCIVSVQKAHADLPSDYSNQMFCLVIDGWLVAGDPVVCGPSPAIQYQICITIYDVAACGVLPTMGWWATIPSTCTADSSCAASTPEGKTCTDACGNVYDGTKTAGPLCAVNATQPCSFSNSCGMTNYGTVNCDGTCSVGTPPESSCPSYSQGTYYSQSTYYSQGSYAPTGCGTPAATITATPSRVRSGQTSVLALAGTGVTTSCTITGPGVNSTTAASSCNVAKTLTTPAITTQTTYTVSCDSSTNLTKVIVNPIPTVVEF